MSNITTKDREILRELASKKLEFANSTRNDEILALWNQQAKGVRDMPTVRLLFSNFRGEVVENRLRCEGEDARSPQA